MTRIPAAIAGLALVAVTAVGCGSDDGGDDTATDPGTSGATTSPSTSSSESATESPTESATETGSGDPVPSPVINQAVRDAIKDDFPALVPAGVPAGWTVVSATYEPKGGGVWTVSLTDPDGLPVTLMQSTASSADLVARLLPGGEADGKVKVSGTGRWTSYAAASGAALAKDLSGTGAVVVGPTAEAVKTLAEQLLTAEDAGNADGG
jgi:hypothetical protein